MPSLNTYPLIRAAFPAAAVLSGAALHAVVPEFWPVTLLGTLFVCVGAAVVYPDPRPTGGAPHLVPEEQTMSVERLALLESAVVHTHDAVVILEALPRSGPGRAVLYVNDAFCRMTGYAREEVVGRSLHFLRGPKSDPATLDEIREALAAGRSLRVELRNYRKDGSEFWVDLSLVPAPDGRGGATHWVMIQRDITDRKAAEEALRRSEALFRGIFENTSAGVSLTDREGRFVSCNPAFAAMAGRSVEEVVGLTPTDITHPDDIPHQRPLMDELVAGARDRLHVTKRYVHPDGKVVWAEVSVVAVRGPGGEFEYGLGVSMNVTERRRLEEQLQHSQKLEAVGQMAGGVAHDFNNLLTAVLCNLELIHLPPGDPNAGHLEAVARAVARAADLTGKLLGYARRNQLVSVPVHPADAFADTVSLFRHTLDPRVRVVVDAPNECPAVQADPTLLSQALMNLCLNSRDAMPDGGTLTLSARAVELTEADLRDHPEARPGPFVLVSVADTGCGMSKEVRARIFEPFFTTKGVGKGTGLGLPMVQGIVNQHRGWVACDSAPGKGTRIDLYLPPADADARRPILRSPPPAPPAEALTRTPPPRALAPIAPDEEQATVLLVDDESMIRDIGRVVLEQAGFRVMTADDGAEAVDVFAREHPAIDLVVLDVTMPRMSGRDAFRHLVEIDPGVRVLFSTGFSSEDIVELDGSVGLLGKPYRPHELLTAVRSALKGSPAA